MNVVTVIMVVFSMLAVVDRITGNHFGLGKEFERGLMLLGVMAMSMVGMIVVAPMIAHYISPALNWLALRIPFDPSSVAGALLANDMGGAPLALELGLTEETGYFNGLIVGSMMGATISFTIPFSLSMTSPHQHRNVLLGLMSGICTVPVGCLVSGLMVGLSAYHMAINLIPLTLLCGLLVVGLLKVPELCVRIFRILGAVITTVILLGLGAGIFTFLTGITIHPYLAPIEEGRDVIFNASMVMTGAFPLVYVLSRLVNRPMQVFGKRLGINATAALGLISTLATCATTYGIMEEMDEKGVVLNSAFTVSAAFVFAGHLAYTLAFNGTYLFSVIVGKLIAGVTSVLLASFIWNKMNRRVPAQASKADATECTQAA